MSAELRGALPGSVELEFGPPSRSLFFEPILDFGDAPNLPEGISADGFGGSTFARGNLSRGTASGSLMVEVRRSEASPPPCVAGELDRRTTLADGSIIDSQDSWVENEGERSLTRDVTAYLPDDTRIYVRADDETSKAGQRHSGAVPLTVEELTAIVTTAGLRVTAPVPVGIPSPPESCAVGEGEDATYEFDRATVDRLNRALDEHWQRQQAGSATLDRPLGSLQLSDLDAGRSGVCEVLTVTTPESEGRLQVAIAAQAPPRVPESPEDSFGPRRSTTTLPDGSVVDRVEAWPSVAPDGPGDAAVTEVIRAVTVTRPSGVRGRTGGYRGIGRVATPKSARSSSREAIRILDLCRRDEFWNWSLAWRR